MHLEERGIPVVTVVTTAFTSSVDDQLNSFNFPDYRATYIEHPVASAAAPVVHAKTDRIVEQVLEQLLGRRP